MTTTTTTLTTLPSDIIHTHILPRLDGPSLSSTATVSSHLHHLCSDDHLWADVTKSTWPSTTHPRVNTLISTFPSGHRSFFHDSFPALFSDTHYRSSTPPPPSTTVPPQLISAVDIRFKNDVVYSAVQFTDTSPDFLTSELQIGFSDDPTCPGSGSETRITRPIDVEVDELAGADLATLADLEQSVTLSWIMIYPTQRRSGNISSIKPVAARQDWMGNETVLKFVTVLPGSDPGEMVKCKIELVLGVNVGMCNLHVKHVGLKVENLSYRGLNGGEFLVILQRAILEENNVRRKVMDGEDRLRRYKEFKEMRRMKKEYERVEEEKGCLLLR
ncbi:putative F-box-like domain superfamily protein [Helianthus annuus]|nr:putative F-box-like domain superfamily protein [Helianthus annuus]